MLKKEEIKENGIVYWESEDNYYLIKNVGNAKEKGDRNISTIYDDELSYNIMNILNNSIETGICEHSGMTFTCLHAATRKDVILWLEKLKLNSISELNIVKKEHSQILSAINKFEKLDS